MGSSRPRPAVSGIRRTAAAVSIERTLKPGDVIASEWEWSNWCGRGGPFELAQIITGRGGLLASPGIWTRPLVARPASRRR